MVISLRKQQQKFKHGLAEEQGKVRAILASISVLFFLVVLSYDSFHYFKDKQWILMAINAPIITYLVTTLFVKTHADSKQRLMFVLIYVLVTLSIVISNWFYAFHTEFVEVYTFRILLVSCFIVIGARFLLKGSWSYALLIFLVANYGLICLYAESGGMNAHFLVVTIILFALDYWISEYTSLNDMVFKEALNNQKEIMLLNEVADLDKQQIRDALVNLAEKSEEAGVDLTGDIEMISCVVDSGMSVNSGRRTGATSEREQFEKRIMAAHPDLTPLDVDLAYIYLSNGRAEDIAESMSCSVEDARNMRKDLRAKLSPSGGLRRYLLIFDSDD